MKTILALSFSMLISTFSAISANAQEIKNYTVFTANGDSSSVDKIIDAAANSDVVFLGERHDDATAHALELEILKAAFAKFGSQRKIILSMEMFERDVQLPLDEYLAGYINEPNFIAATRAWTNYKTDYSPLVEFAKSNKIPVIAANAPRRYVNLVNRSGKKSLMDLSATAKNYFPQLPFADSSEKYARNFNALMGAMPAHNSNLLDAQTFWDATMADSLATQLKKESKSLIIHLNGSFHSESRLGTPEQLTKYAPKANFLVVTMRPETDFTKFNEASHENTGDFVILTKDVSPQK